MQNMINEKIFVIDWATECLQTTQYSQIHLQKNHSCTLAMVIHCQFSDLDNNSYSVFFAFQIKCQISWVILHCSQRVQVCEVEAVVQKW